jgi:chorismate mutase
MSISKFKHSIPNQPLIIAGPCSAETQEQVLAVAEKIDKQKVNYFRAGIWKPRTRPGSFEGVGSIGLEWLKEVRSTYNQAVCTEVANARHVEECLKADIDLLWIGARTTTNPFAVQEIADALKGTDVEVLIKNPINPDLNLWRGAIERIQLAGITKIGAIHRGFSKYGQHKYRNEPQWQIPIELKRTNPELPIICDPSHMGGKREYITPLSQKAYDLSFNGLMIESHCTPDEAWSDAAQQVTPDVFNSILDTLVVSFVSPNSEAQKSLLELRNEIDELDTQMIETIKQRMQVIKKIGLYKKEHQMTILQAKRWTEILEKNTELAKRLDLDTIMIEEILESLHQSSINLQEKVIRKN